MAVWGANVLPAIWIWRTHHCVRNNKDDATEYEDSNKDTADESESAVAEEGYSADSVHPIPTPKRKVPKQRDVDKILSFMKERNRPRKELNDVDYFFASAAESVKKLPRGTQIKIKVKWWEL